MRTPGSPKLPSVVFIVDFGLTSSPFLAPHECMTCGHSSPEVPGGGLAGGTHSTVYGSGGAVMAATRIWLSGSDFSFLMSETNWLIGVRCMLSPTSFDWQSVMSSVGGL